MNTLQFIRQNLNFLAAGFLLTLGSCFGQTFFISIFAGEIRAEFGLSHGGWGAIYMIGTLASAFVMIWAGVLTDVFRVRVLGGIVIASIAGACAFMAIVPSLWLLPLAIFALRLAGQGMLSHIASVAMARWYVAERGRALAISSFGFMLGEALFPILFVIILTYVGWRWSWGVSAIMALALLPAIFLLLKSERTPQSVAEENQCFGMMGRHWTRPEVLKHWLFWLLLPFLLGQPAFGTAFFFHQVHLAEVKGWSHLSMVSLFPLYTSIALVATILTGFAIDRFGTARLLPFMQLPIAFGFFIFSMTHSLFSAGLGIALFGMSSGINAALISAFWAEFFGTRHLGAIKAMATAVMVFASAIGPGLTGWIIDQGMNFSDQMGWITGFFLISAVLAGTGIKMASPALPDPS